MSVSSYINSPKAIYRLYDQSIAGTPMPLNNGTNISTLPIINDINGNPLLLTVYPGSYELTMGGAFQMELLGNTCAFSQLVILEIGTGAVLSYTDSKSYVQGVVSNICACIFNHSEQINFTKTTTLTLCINYCNSDADGTVINSQINDIDTRAFMRFISRA
jgi:hypothetical protein